MGITSREKLLLFQVVFWEHDIIITFGGQISA